MERKIQYSVLRVYSKGYADMAQWLSWLERRPVTAEVTGSSPVWVVFLFKEETLVWRNRQTQGT